MTSEHIDRLIRKARQSVCNYKIAALGLNHRGEVLITATNKPRFMAKGRGIHAEMEVMKRAGPSLKTIIICRVNKSGELRPIVPCSVCSAKAKEIGIKIVSIL